MAYILKTSAQAYFPPKYVFVNEFSFTTDVTKIIRTYSYQIGAT